MAKPKAERWLTTTFIRGVDETARARMQIEGRAYPRASPLCCLAKFDSVLHPCSHVVEAAHFIPRQRVENALWEMLRDAGIIEDEYARAFLPEERDEIILIAAWDPRNGGLACQHHHRRFDAHAGSPRAPKIVVPRARLPVHVEEFICDYGFDGMGWLDERFPR